jgi:hypothetical protein
MPTREEAIAQLEVAGHRDAADHVRRWRNRDGRTGGWDANVKAAFPDTRALLWPGKQGIPVAHLGSDRDDSRPESSGVAELQRKMERLRRSTAIVPAFDAYWAVDWSARSEPAHGANSLWWALLRWPDGREASPTLDVGNPRTRQSFMDEVLRRLSSELAGARVLLGFDFPLGYPRGFARALGGPDSSGPAWRAAWNRLERDIRDGKDNANNRFEVAAALNAELTGGFGPFWGRPDRAAGAVSAHLSATRNGLLEYPLLTHAGVRLPEWRAADRRAGTASSSWFVYGGPNSVGGQALLGIPRVAFLRRTLSDARVWPFETGAALPSRAEARIVVAEIYPTLFHDRAAVGVKDELQVMAAVLAFAERDATGTLQEWFAAPEDPAVLEEEGWVLGVAG